MKYIIDLPEEFAEATKEYWNKTVGTQLEPYAECSRKVIEDEIWSFVNFLENKLKASDYDFIFDDNSPYDKYTYQEAKDKYEEWHTQKQNEIKVGEEIVGIYSDGEKTPPLVVFKVEGNYYYGMYSKTGDFVQGGLNYEKTGRYFPEVAELLKKMRGAE